MKDLISIVVPVYNVEKYLKKCVDSLRIQTYKTIEILLIDDGSTDTSGLICDEFCNLDARIRVIHKTNGGLSDARNMGLKIAKGEYICFIDSDDYIDSDMIQMLYYGCITSDSKVACCGKFLEKENGEFIKINYYDEPFLVNKKEALKKMLLVDGIDTSSCDKLFKTTLFENIQFPKNKYYEDLGTIYKVINRTNRIYHIGQAKYHYIKRDGSITQSKFNIKHLDYLTFSKEICSYFENNDAELFLCAKAFYYLALCDMLQIFYNKKAIKDYKKIYLQLRTEYKNNIIDMLKNKNIMKLKKVMIVLVYFRLYRIVNFTKKLRIRVKLY